MALSLRLLKAMASIVRSSVRKKSRTEQVAEPSSDRAMRLNPSPEQADPPSSCSFQARLCSLLGRWADWFPSARVQRNINDPTKLARFSPLAGGADPGAQPRPSVRLLHHLGWPGWPQTCAPGRTPPGAYKSNCCRVSRSASTGTDQAAHLILACRVPRALIYMLLPSLLVIASGMGTD